MGMSQTQEKPRKVVIAGDGYAGVMCANRLAGTLGSRVEITSVNPIAELVYAAGSGEVAETVPGIKEHAHSVSSLDGARRLKTALAALPAGRTVLVVAYRWAKARNSAPVTASRAERVNA
jgi:NADH dehydrogenase FAD-containing subunit